MREGQILVGCQVFPGLLCDVAGHRIIPLESGTAIACPCRISREAPDNIRRIGLPHSRNRHRDGHCQIGEWVFCAQRQQPGSSTAHADNPGAVIAEQVIRIDVPKDRRTFDSNPQAPRKHLIRQMVNFCVCSRCSRPAD